MIAASIAFAFALYTTGVTTIRTVHMLKTGSRDEYLTMPAIMAAASWGLFYYFTHA